MTNALKALAKKKTLFALVLALTIFGAVYGFAATLNVGTNQLSAGNATSRPARRPARRPAPTRSPTTRRSPATRSSSVHGHRLDAACADQDRLGDAHRRGAREPRHAHGRRPGRRRPLALTPGATRSSAAARSPASRVAING